jgi:hypothetical protein
MGKMWGVSIHTRSTSGDSAANENWHERVESIERGVWRGIERRSVLYRHAGAWKGYAIAGGRVGGLEEPRRRIGEEALDIVEDLAFVGVLQRDRLEAHLRAAGSIIAQRLDGEQVLTGFQTGQHPDYVAVVRSERDLDWRPVQRHDEIVRRHCSRNLNPHLYVTRQRQLLVGRANERQRRRRIVEA